MTAEPMAEERLAEIREDLTCAYQGPEWGEINDMAHELLDEIERLRELVVADIRDLFDSAVLVCDLRSENERLRSANERLKADVGVAESALFDKRERSKLRAEKAALSAGLDRALAFLSDCRSENERLLGEKANAQHPDEPRNPIGASFNVIWDTTEPTS